jgi:hypothetical protein
MKAWAKLALDGMRMVADFVRGGMQARRLDKIERIKPIGAENKAHENLVRRRREKKT